MAARLTAVTITVIAIIALVWGVLHLFIGRTLRRHRPSARLMSLALALGNLILFPFGTALGGYACWVLLKDEGRRLFEEVQRCQGVTVAADHRSRRRPGPATKNPFRRHPAAANHAELADHGFPVMTAGRRKAAARAQPLVERRQRGLIRMNGAHGRAGGQLIGRRPAQIERDRDQDDRDRRPDTFSSSIGSATRRAAVL